MTKKVSIKDVANRAGVSVAAVSYVLNGIDKVSPERKAHILKTIHEMNYKPSMIARSLSGGASKLIGVALPITEEGDRPGDLFGNNPFFGEFLGGIENAIFQGEYDILISCLNSDKEYKNWVQRRNLDGIILLGTYPKSIFEEISTLDIPVVLTDVYEEYARDFYCVRIDDEWGGYVAVKHLIDLGHRNIAFVSGSINSSYVNYFRYQGYLRALKEAGIEPDERLFFKEHVDYDGGYRIGTKMALENTGATAAFVVADIMAIGLMKSYFEHGKSIPGDLSVVGFDDIQFSKFVAPGLTTLRQDIAAKGRLSAQMIMEGLHSGSKTKDSVVLRPELIVRESTAKLDS